jgi:hypothetical protein
MTTRISALTLTIGVLFPMATLGDDAKPASRTMSSSGNTSAGEGANSYGVSSASLLSWDGRAVACYGVSKTRMEAEKYAYFFVFKAPVEAADDPAEIEFNGSQSMAAKIEAKESPTIALLGGKRKWSYRYQLEANGDLTKVLSETLTIDGKVIKTSEARVFLVDLTQEKPTARAVKVDLPKSVPDLAGKKNSLEIVEKAIAELKASSKEVKEFLEAAPKK